MQVAVIGIGIIGAKLVEALLRAEHDVVVYNRTLSKAKQLEDKGAVLAETVPDAIKAAETIILTLSGKKAIDDVFSSITMTMKHKTIIQMGTISPQESVALAQVITVAGGAYIECPILGSRREIEEKKLILLCGGSREQFDRWKSFLGAFGPEPHYVGEVGTAAALKLALNQLIAIHAVGFSLSLGIIERSHIDRQLFMDVLRQSSLYAPMYDKKLSNWVDREFSNPNFPAKHLLKDVRLISEYAGELGLNSAAMESVRKILEETIERGYEDMDYSSVISVIHPQES